MPKHHLDKRTEQLIAAGEEAGSADQLLTTPQAADWLAVSTQFLEIGRVKGYGPPFVALAPRAIRYKRGDVLEWLRGRTHSSTAEYT